MLEALLRRSSGTGQYWMSMPVSECEPPILYPIFTHVAPRFSTKSARTEGAEAFLGGCPVLL